MKKTLPPEPLAIMNERATWKEPGRHVVPVQSPDYLAACRSAAEAHQRVNRTDPFAGARILTHCARGIESPHDVQRRATVAMRRQREAAPPLGELPVAFKQAAE